MANLKDDANCQGAWLFADDLTDESGEGNTLTPSDTLTYSTTRPSGFTSGKSLDLQGDRYAYRANADLSASFPGKVNTPDFAFAFWFNTDNWTSARYVFGKYIWRGYFDWRTGALYDEFDHTHYHGGFTHDKLFSGLSAGTWYHVVVSCDGEGGDGDTVRTAWVSSESAFGDVLDADQTTYSGKGQLDAGGYQFSVGASYNGSSPFAGYLYQLIIFNRTLNAAEAEELYTYGFDYAGGGGSAVPIIAQQRQQAARRRRSGLFAIQMPGWIRRESGLLVKA